MKPDIWVAGRVRGSRWEILGIYDDEHLALARCYDSDCFIGPLHLNQDLPDEAVEWPGCYFTDANKSPAP